MIYLIGSLANPDIRNVAARLRSEGFDTWDDWHSAGKDADISWQEYEKERGRGYKEALAGDHAEWVFNMDTHFLRKADAVVLVRPAGKSAHLELGWSLGQGKPGFVLFDGEPEKFDVMYRFATGVCMSVDELVEALKPYRGTVH